MRTTGKLPPGLAKNADPAAIPDLAASFQTAVIDVLVRKCQQALRQTQLKTLAVGGGRLAANMLLRQRLAAMCASEGVDLVIPPPALCTDNAAMAALSRRKVATPGLFCAC